MAPKHETTSATRTVVVVVVVVVGICRLFPGGAGGSKAVASSRAFFSFQEEWRASMDTEHLGQVAISCKR
jgi:hypothetical protein